MEKIQKHIPLLFKKKGLDLWLLDLKLPLTLSLKQSSRTACLVPQPTWVLLGPEIGIGCSCTERSVDLEIKPSWPEKIIAYLRLCRGWWVTVLTAGYSSCHSKYVH